MATSVAQDSEAMRLCKACLGRGTSGLEELKKVVQKAGDAAWVRQISIIPAIVSDSLPSVRYLFEEVHIQDLEAKLNGYTPLQMAVVWGKLDILVYLLSVGADPMLRENSIVAMARLRQKRLRRAFDESSEGEQFEGFIITQSKIEPLIKEGLAMLEVLEGVELLGSFWAWAQRNPAHSLVQRFARKSSCAEQRYEVVILTALIQRSRAEMLPLATRLAMVAEEAAQIAAQAKEERPLRPLLIEEGFGVEAAKAIVAAFRQAGTLKELRQARLSEEAIEEGLESYVRTKWMSEGEKRKFLRFVRELEEPEQPEPVAAASAAAASSTGKAPAAAKAKPKAANKAALAGLRAMAGGKGSKGAAQKTGSSSGSAAVTAKNKAAAANDGMAVLFHPDLPSGALMVTTRFLL